VIPWDFIWEEGGKGKRTENRYRPVSVSSLFLTAVDRYGGRDVSLPRSDFKW
jgi:hypothetical protein